MIEFLIEPLTYEFMRTALATAVVVGLTASTLSVFVVLRGWSLLGDAISHSVLPGLAFSAAFNLPLTLGGAVAGVVASLLVALVESRSRVRNDTAIGIVLTGAFALGLVIISRIRPTVDVFHILFGNVLGVSPQDLLLTAALGFVVILLISLFMKEIIAFTFDPLFTYVVGLPTNLIHYSLMIMMSLTIIAALQTVGIVLVISLLVAPGATAQLFARTLGQMLLVSLTVGVFSSVAGLYLSYYFAVSSGGAIALTATLVFFSAMMLKRR
ncbi:MAG: metal ABC transporter permease [Candidatus Caldarchaeum sp.]|nr:metal ABC transporter permease [Candidatus Caldarchaeum sp.]MDW8360273.1 metal ABC transporter permease [Candidatus Caldarchaeum sp.]